MQNLHQIVIGSVGIVPYVCLLLNKNDFQDLATTVGMRDLNQVW